MQEIKLQKNYDLYIGGQFVPPIKGNRMDIINPANGEVLASVANGDAADVDIAINAAWDAFPAWRQTTARERAEMMYKISEKVEQHFEDFAIIET